MPRYASRQRVSETAYAITRRPTYHKRDLVSQKRPTMTKETYYETCYHKRDLLSQKRPAITKETYYITKETYYDKRDLL